MYCDVNSRDEIVKEITAKEKACKTPETASINVIQADMTEMLEKELEQSVAHSPNDAGRYVDKVMIAEFQTDALMMGKFISGLTMMIASSDADIPIFTGDDCIVLEEITRDGSMELICTSEATLCRALSFLSDKDREKVTLHPTEHPILMVYLTKNYAPSWL